MPTTLLIAYPDLKTQNLHGVHIHAVAVFSLTKIFIQIGPQLICDQIQNRKILKHGQLMHVKSCSKISIQ
jgi:hypothetical protein